jgi:hypothetical protein
VLIPQSSSDRSKAVLEELLKLRWTSGSLNELYLDESTAPAVATRVERRVADLECGE